MGPWKAIPAGIDLPRTTQITSRFWKFDVTWREGRSTALGKERRPVLVLGDFNGKIRFDESCLLQHGFGEEKDDEMVFGHRITIA